MEYSFPLFLFSGLFLTAKYNKAPQNYLKIKQIPFSILKNYAIISKVESKENTKVAKNPF